MPPGHRPKRPGQGHANPNKTPREIAKSNPALAARLANCVHILEEAVKSGGDGSLEIPTPPSRASCAPARRARQSQGHLEGHCKRHRNPKPPRCTNEGYAGKLGVPREPKFLRFLWLVLLLTSPGSKERARTTVASNVDTGTFPKEWLACFAPGDPHLHRHLRSTRPRNASKRLYFFIFSGVQLWFRCLGIFGLDFRLDIVTIWEPEVRFLGPTLFLLNLRIATSSSLVPHVT